MEKLRDEQLVPLNHLILKYDMPLSKVWSIAKSNAFFVGYKPKCDLELVGDMV